MAARVACTSAMSGSSFANCSKFSRASRYWPAARAFWPAAAYFSACSSLDAWGQAGCKKLKKNTSETNQHAERSAQRNGSVDGGPAGREGGAPKLLVGIRKPVRQNIIV